MARVPNEATAFAHRDRPIMLNVANIYGPDDDPTEAEEWVAGTADALVGDDRSGYANFFLDEPDRVRLAYPGGTWDRLRTIKGRYDPTNLFHLNQNIPPLHAGGSANGAQSSISPAFVGVKPHASK